MSAVLRPSVSDTVTDADAIDELTRDLKATRSRNSILLRALNGDALVSTPVSTIVPEGLLRVAQSLEASGCMPVVRFARDERNRIAGIELAFVAPEKRITRELTPPGAEMGVID